MQGGATESLVYQDIAEKKTFTAEDTDDIFFAVARFNNPEGNGYSEQLVTGTVVESGSGIVWDIASLPEGAVADEITPVTQGQAVEMMRQE